MDVKFDKDKKPFEVVVVLPYVGDKVLMQLRDFKKGITFPGKWGFFGGSIEGAEKPNEAAKRELLEEIGYSPKILNRLDKGSTPEFANLIFHSFICRLTVPTKKLVLNEGFDLGIFTLKEICSKRLLSYRDKKYHSVIDSPYIEYLVRKLMQRVKK